MGRIKTKLVKKIGNELVERYGQEFGIDFEQNKKVVAKYLQTSKKLRNIIAGYIVKLKKQEREREIRLGMDKVGKEMLNK
jgi:ribosomal protein S17E